MPDKVPNRMSAYLQNIIMIYVYMYIYVYIPSLIPGDMSKTMSEYVRVVIPRRREGCHFLLPYMCYHNLIFACLLSLLTNFFAQPRRHEGFLHPVPPWQRGSCASAARAAAAGAGAPSRAFDPAAGDSGAAGRAQVAGCGE